MNRWRAEYDDGIWRFYRDGMELGLYEKGDVVIDALNNAESRIAELEDQLEDWTNNGWAEDYKARIAELEEKQRWIPVSERLPDNWKLVLTIAMSERVRVPVPAFYDPETSLWSTRFTYDLWVTHWMPLPEPPEVK